MAHLFNFTLNYLLFLLILFQNCHSPTVEIESEIIQTDDINIIIPEQFIKVDDHPDFLYVYWGCTNDVDSINFYKSEEIDSTYIIVSYFNIPEIDFQEVSNETIKSDRMRVLIKDLGYVPDYFKVLVNDDYIYDEYFIQYKNLYDYRLTIIDRSARTHVQLESLRKENVLSDIFKVRNELIKKNLKL